MRTTEDKVIMYDSDEAAQFKTVQGWVSSNGRFYGDDEHTARYAGSTHKLCEGCGSVMRVRYIKCHSCQEKASTERYNQMPFKEWDGKQMVYSQYFDKYYYDIDYFTDDCWEEQIQPSEAMLILCEPNYWKGIDYDHWADDMPEDGDDSLPKELEAALKVVNEIAAKLPPISYSPGRYRTTCEEVIEFEINPT